LEVKKKKKKKKKVTTNRRNFEIKNKKIELNLMFIILSRKSLTTFSNVIKVNQKSKLKITNDFRTLFSTTISNTSSTTSTSSNKSNATTTSTSNPTSKRIKNSEICTLLHILKGATVKTLQTPITGILFYI